jgi:hypothetical protein
MDALFAGETAKLVDGKGDEWLVLMDFSGQLRRGRPGPAAVKDKFE